MDLRSTTRVTVLLLTAVLLLSSLASRAPGSDDVFVQVLADAVTSLDPAQSTKTQDWQVTWLLFDALTQLSADATRILPALAERWETSADGLTYTFHLRRNVRFHDGTFVDAEAVKASYERRYLPTSPYYTPDRSRPYEKIMSGWIKQIRTLDSHTVVITTHYARPQQFAQVSIVSLRALGEKKGDLSRTPIGTGPFRLQRWEGKEVILQPFLESWHGRPKLAGVRFVAQSDDTESVRRLAAGESHLGLNTPSDFYEQLRANPRVRLIPYGGLNTMFLGMQLDRPPLKDRRVREAIVRAVDRERIATVLGRGAMIASRSILPPNCPGFDAAISQPTYDPDRARALLRDAGMASGLRVRLLYHNPLEVWSEVVHAVQADLEKVGIGAELLRASSWTDYHVERKKNAHELYLYSWGVSAPDPERFLYPLFYSQSENNFGRLTSKQIDDLLTEARHPMEPSRRLQIFSQANGLVVGEIPALFLVHRINMAGVSTRLTGLELNLEGLPQDKLVTVEIH